MANIFCTILYSIFGNILLKLLIGRILLVLITIISLLTGIAGPSISLASSLSSSSSPSSMIMNDKIKVTIGTGGINRLHFAHYPISQIIGDENKYSIFTSRDNKNLFITPYFNAGEQAELSIIDAAGKVCDIELIASNKPGQAILIPSKSLQQYRINRGLAQRKEIKQMIQAMILEQNIDDKYYIEAMKRNIRMPVFAAAGAATDTADCTTQGLSIIQDQSYRYDDLIGVRLLVANNNKDGVIKLDKNKFKNLFKSVIALKAEQDNVAAGKQTKLWLISQMAVTK